MGSNLAYTSEIIYRRPIPFAPGALDTRYAPNESETFLYRQVFDPLFRYEGMELKGNLVTTWKILDGGKQFNLHLKKVTFHNGQPMNGQDVAYTFNRLIQAKQTMGALLSPIKRIIVSDEGNEITIELNKPNPQFLLRLSDPATGILKRGESSSGLNGTGPFKVISQPEKEFILEKNNNYHNKVPEIDKLIVQVVSKVEAIEGYLNGKYDDLFHFLLTKGERERLKEKCNWHFELLPTFRFMVIKADTNLALRSKEARGCLMSLIKREEFIEQIDPGQPKMDAYLPKNIFGGELLTSYLPPECQASTLRALIKASKRNPIRVAGVSPAGPIDLYPPKKFEDAGVKTKLKLYADVAQFLSSLRSRNIDIFIARYTARTPESESFLYPFIGIPPLWPLGLSPDNFQSKLSEIENTLDRRKRSKLVARIFDQIADERVLLPIHQYEFSGCVSGKWKNIVVPVTGFLYQDMSLISRN